MELCEVVACEISGPSKRNDGVVGEDHRHLVSDFLFK